MTAILTIIERKSNIIQPKSSQIKQKSNQNQARSRSSQTRIKPNQAEAKIQPKPLRNPMEIRPNNPKSSRNPAESLREARPKPSRPRAGSARRGASGSSAQCHLGPRTSYPGGPMWGPCRGALYGGPVKEPCREKKNCYKTTSGEKSLGIPKESSYGHQSRIQGASQCSLCIRMTGGSIAS